MCRLFKTVFLILLPVLISSCGNDGGVKYRIGVSQCSSGPWREKQNSEMQRELLLHDGVTMELACADDDSRRQIEQIQHYINERVDIIVASPSEGERLKPVIERAYKAGIPVLLFDRDIAGHDHTAFVGGDNVGVGRQLADFAMTRLPHGGKVVELKGSMNTTPAQQRHQGFASEISERKDIQVVASLDAGWNGYKAARMLRQVLKTSPDVDVVVAHNDYMASVAKAGIDSLHLSHRIQYVGVDGFGSDDWGLVAVERGNIEGTVIYPTGGNTIIQVAIDILSKKKVAKETLLPGSLVTDPKEAHLLLAMNNEMEHESETVIRLRDRVRFYGHQQALEETVILAGAALLVLAVCLIIMFWIIGQQRQRANESLQKQQDELQRQHTQLLEMTRELEAATNAKLVFFTNVSHDFRTPLTLISAPLEAVVNDLENPTTQQPDNQTTKQPDNQTTKQPNNPTTQQPNNQTTKQPNNQTTNLHLLHIAQRNVKVLLGLINQILDFRKIENGKMSLNLQLSDLGHSLQQWVEAFQQYGMQKGIAVLLACDRTQDWNIMVDVKKMEAILYNLIGNAMKFTPRGGRITVSCVRNEASATISVADTGCGIDKEHVSHIFERFYQIDPAQHNGSGIGLALVQNLVTLMHGTIGIQSETDTSRQTGTTITIEIPVKEGEKVGSATPAPASPASFVMQDAPVPVLPDAIPEISEDETRQVVLVIDDNADIVSFIQTLLSSRYRVECAMDGASGLKIAQETIPDIILCDVMMPVMDGMECCRRLKSDVRTSHIPVLMLTACSLDEQRVQGLQEGAEAYISKPFSVTVLMAQIETMLRNRGIVGKSIAERAGDSVASGKGSMAGTKGSVAGGHPLTPARPSPQSGDDTPDDGCQISTYDQEFLGKMQKRIKEGIGDTDFNVETLASAMCLSRVQLYRKCKALTGSTPVELIRNTRLEKGRELLAGGTQTIASVARAVGFADAAYFARCYKSYFGEACRQGH